jgi:hypothetical protein
MSGKCKFRKKNGARCAADAQTGKDMCVFHDPSRGEDGHRARRTGGINSRRAPAVLPPDTPDSPLESASNISTLIAESINQLRRGQLDPRVANAIGYLASVQLRSLEQSRLEERIAKLEGALGLIAIPQIATLEPEASEHCDDND